MSLKSVAFLAALAGVLMFGPSASRGAVILSVDDVFVAPGETAVVGVYASSTASEVISAFNLPFDFNNDGFVDADGDTISDLPAGFTLGTPPSLAAEYSVGLDRPMPQVELIDADVIINTNNVHDVTLPATRLKLFDIVFEVDASVSPGTVVPLRLFAPDAPFTGLFRVSGPAGTISPADVAAPLPGAPVFGSITVVPEPAGIAGGVGLAMILLTRRSRRRAAVRVG